jgi:uncharacterized protein YeaO (DUF488 family)
MRSTAWARTNGTRKPDRRSGDFDERRSIVSKIVHRSLCTPSAKSYAEEVVSVIDLEARIKTKRWNDPVERDDGHRLLACRYRPRGVRKDAETWDAWSPQLGPSRELHAEYYGKHGPPIDWSEFRRRYLTEMREQAETIAYLVTRASAGERITLLCSSACMDP